MKQMVVFAGLLAAPALTAADHQDPRLKALQVFFKKYACPVSGFAAEFVDAADQNDLDWRLLPSISVIESGGGKATSNNNIFGWDSGRPGFPSIRAAIHTVASRLANSKLYKHKSLDGILNTYNPRPEYPYRVKSVMRVIGSADLGLNTALN